MKSRISLAFCKSMANESTSRRVVAELANWREVSVDTSKPFGFKALEWLVGYSEARVSEVHLEFYRFLLAFSWVSENLILGTDHVSEHVHSQINI
jgi:hypothetical protein